MSDEDGYWNVWVDLGVMLKEHVDNVEEGFSCFNDDSHAVLNVWSHSCDDFFNERCRHTEGGWVVLFLGDEIGSKEGEIFWEIGWDEGDVEIK